MVKPSGASNWSKPETDYLLDIVEDIIPFQPEEWNEVKARFDERYAKKRRGIKAIRRRYEFLHRTKEPTGDPRIPSPVLRAQNVKLMIDEKMDATRGSPESGLNAPGVGSGDHDEDVDDDDDDNDADADKEVEDLNGNDGFLMTPMTNNAVTELARLSGHADKPFFEPTVQVINLKKKQSSECHEVIISDGTTYMTCSCAKSVSALIDEEYFTLFSYIKVQEFSTTTLANGERACQLLLVENPMIPNPAEKIGNPINISHARARPVVPKFSSVRESPAFVPASITFSQSLRGLKNPMSAKKGGGVGGSGGDEFNNIMYMMMMQQQSDREQRIADREHRDYLAEQAKIEREEKERREHAEREERAREAREDRIQQQEDRKQQQQFLNMMMMKMMGGGNKREREESDGEIENEDTPRKKSPRKK
jgi:hypothetical protein